MNRHAHSYYRHGHVCVHVLFRVSSNQKSASIAGRMPHSNPEFADLFCVLCIMYSGKDSSYTCTATHMQTCMIRMETVAEMHQLPTVLFLPYVLKFY